MRTLLTTTLFTLALLAGGHAVAPAADSDRCYDAARREQTAAIDHAVGRASEQQYREARAAADRACRPTR